MDRIHLCHHLSSGIKAAYTDHILEGREVPSRSSLGVIWGMFQRTTGWIWGFRADDVTTPLGEGANKPKKPFEWEGSSMALAGVRTPDQLGNIYSVARSFPHGILDAGAIFGTSQPHLPVGPRR